MGNQMFQLAFAHAASRQLGTSFLLQRPRVKRRADATPLWDAFELGSLGRRRTRARRELEFLVRHTARSPLVTVEQQDEPEEALSRLVDGATYHGFFQSERWFAAVADEVRELFTVHPAHRAARAARHPDLPPYICMHVRRGDYLETGLWALPISYFLDALASIPDRERYELIVVSDDPEGVRGELADVAGVRCAENPPMVDLLLLMNADAVITSNSSFSWWGAWLNTRPGLRVIAPKHWLGFAAGAEEPSGVIPRGWQTIPVRDAPLART